MFVIDSGKNDRIDFDGDPLFFQPLQRFKLVHQQNHRAFFARIEALAVTHPGINLRADFGVDCIDRQRDMADIQPRQFFDMHADVQPVRRNAEQHVGITFSDEPQRFHRLFGICKRIARPGNADDRYLRLAQHSLV